MASRAMLAMKSLRRSPAVGVQTARRMFSDAPAPGTRANNFGVRRSPAPLNWNSCFFRLHID